MFGGRSGPKKHFGGTWSRVLPAFKPQYMQMEALRLTRSKRADEEAKRQIGIRVTAFGSQPPASSPARRCRPSRELAGERTRRACRVPRPRGTPEAALPTTTLAFSRASPDPRGRGFGTRGGHGDRTWVTRGRQDMGDIFSLSLRRFLGHAVENSFVAQGAPALGRSGAGTPSNTSGDLPPFRC